MASKLAYRIARLETAAAAPKSERYNVFWPDEPAPNIPGEKVIYLHWPEEPARMGQNINDHAPRLEK